MRKPILTMFWAFVSIAASPGIWTAEGPTTQPVAAGDRLWPQRQILEGLVQDTNSKQIGDALVLVFNAQTGEVYSGVTDHPFTDPQWSGELPPVARDITGGNGRFHIRGLFPGDYRFVALAWDAVTPATAKSLDDLDSSAMTLYGIAEDVAIEADRQPPPTIIKPVGTAEVRLQAGGGKMVLISTRPLSGDLLLGELAIKGDFLRHLVAVTFTQGDNITLRGLPAGPLYCFAAGEGGHFAVGKFIVYGKADMIGKSGQTVEARLVYATPADGERPLPQALSAVQAEMKRDRRGVEAALHAAIGADKIEPQNQWRARWALPPDREVILPSGLRTTVRDVITVQSYRRFNQQARLIAKRSDKPAATSPRQGSE